MPTLSAFSAGMSRGERWALLTILAMGRGFVGGLAEREDVDSWGLSRGRFGLEFLKPIEDDVHVTHVRFVRPLVHDQEPPTRQR